MIKSDNKQVVTKGQFDCSFCHSDHYAQKGFDQPIEIGPNDFLKELIGESCEIPLIFCDRHPT